MIFSTTFFTNASGLFDFDLTFPAEAILFIILALVVTSVFLSPISKTLDERAEFIDINIKTSIITLTYAYDKLSTCVELLGSEFNEGNRQTKLITNYTNTRFEDHILSIQKENTRILSKLKGDLAVRAAYLFDNIYDDVESLTQEFFIKKFKS